MIKFHICTHTHKTPTHIIHLFWEFFSIIKWRIFAVENNDDDIVIIITNKKQNNNKQNWHLNNNIIDTFVFQCLFVCLFVFLIKWWIKCWHKQFFFYSSNKLIKVNWKIVMIIITRQTMVKIIMMIGWSESERKTKKQMVFEKFFVLIIYFTSFILIEIVE